MNNNVPGTNELEASFLIADLAGYTSLTETQLKISLRDTTYFFCSPECSEKFQHNPKSYF